jgi:hypothetical protein
MTIAIYLKERKFVVIRICVDLLELLISLERSLQSSNYVETIITRAGI